MAVPPLVLVAAAWMAGLILAGIWLSPIGVEPEALLIVGIVPVGGAILWFRDRDMRLGAVCSLALITACLRYQATLPEFNDVTFVAAHNGRGWVTLEGTVSRAPDVRDTWTNLRLEVDRLERDGHSYTVHGSVLARAARYPEYGYGDRLRVSGLMEAPPSLPTFSYADYLARQGVYSFLAQPRIERLAQGEGNPLQTALLALKGRAQSAIARLVPEPEASLLQGVLLGTRTGIPRSLYDLYNATGTSHILVISGANISLVAAWMSRAFGRLIGRRPAFWFTVSGIGLYVLLVGAEPAVARAGLMGTLYVLAVYLGRRATAHVSLCASGLLLTALNPLVLWDPGFQLSFAATLSLILFTEPIERAFEYALARRLARERARVAVRYLHDLLIVTLAAQILTIPVVLGHFGRLSLVAPLANLLIQPFQSTILGAGAVATILALIPFLAPLAQIVFWVPWLGLAWCTAVVRWLADWPLASVSLDPVWSSRLVIYYIALVGLAAAFGPRRSIGRRLSAWVATRRSRWATPAFLAAPTAVALISWLAAFQSHDGRLHIAFLDIGEGDAILITTPVGQQILIDGGPSPGALAAALGRHMPFWDRSIDRIILTHADSDHILGLPEALRRYRVGGWLDSGRAADNAVYRECEKQLESQGIPRRAIHAGERIALGEGAALDILYPPTGALSTPGRGDDTNSGSLVLFLVWDEASVLLTGDIGQEAETALLQSGQPLSASVLKVAHHGSDGSSTSQFLAAVSPQYAVISAGAGNRFGHPAPTVLDRLSSQGVIILRTDRVGTIELITDGQQWWIETDR